MTCILSQFPLSNAWVAVSETSFQIRWVGWADWLISIVSSTCCCCCKSSSVFNFVFTASSEWTFFKLFPVLKFKISFLILFKIFEDLHIWWFLILLTEAWWIWLSLLLTKLHKNLTWRTRIFLYLRLRRKLMLNLWRYLLVLHNLRNWFSSTLIFWELSNFIHLSLCSQHFIWQYLHFLWLVTINAFNEFLISWQSVAIVFKIAFLLLSTH